MKNRDTTQYMAGALMLIFILAFAIITGRFLYIGATGKVAGVDLKALAKEKRTTSQIIQAKRGKILDSQNMVLAYDLPVYRLYAILDENFSENSPEARHVVDIDLTAQKLANHINMEVAEIKTILQKAKEDEKFQIEFGTKGRNLSKQTKETIENEEIPGIYFHEEHSRYYPNGKFAAHILGFAQKDDTENKIIGMAGMEREMDDLLSGDNGHVSYERDKYGAKLLEPKEVIQQAKDGHDIYLTLDQKIQTFLEDSLSQVAEEYNPERITAAVLNPKTGEILAMGGRPSYNPNDPKGVENWYNDAISTPFEPGSTIKMFTWAAAIESGNYNGNDVFQSGKYKPNRKIEQISDHNQGKGWGNITYDEGFARSSNVAAARLVWDKMGPETFYEYLKKFKLDEKTDVDLPGEVPGEILYNWPSEKIRSSFGQGSTATPIQQLMAASSIFNKGKMMRPYVIKKIVNPTTDKVVEEKEPVVVGEPISEETAAKVKDLLEDVVNSKNGTGNRFRLDDYTVIGKTGTAQIPSKQASGYMVGHGNNIFSFLGAAPKDDPQLMMYVSVTRPKLAHDERGADAVSFIFKNVMENSLHYLNVDPDKNDTKDIQTVKIPEIKEKAVEEIEKELKDKGIKVIKIGNGKRIKKSNVEKDDELLKNDSVILITDKPEIPNLKNWSLREVHELAFLMDLQLETIGSGYVVKQSIEPNKKIKEGDYLAVELEEPKSKKIKNK